MRRETDIILLLLFLGLMSCKQEDKSLTFGTVEYYPSFLWVDSSVTTVTKTFDFDFSQDAKDDGSYAEFQFVDNDGKPIPTTVMQVAIDGKEIENNRFRVESDVASKELTFTFSPEAEDGTHQGYLKLVAHRLDRLDSQPLEPAQQVDAFQWTLNYDKQMNPLAEVLMWLGIALVSALMLWFILVRGIVYDYIKVGSIRITDSYYSQRRIKGARQVVFTNKSVKQSALSRIFTGRIIYEVNPVWTTPVIFEPTSRGEVKMRRTDKYTIDPYDFKLRKGEEYTLINEDTKERIILSIY